MAGDCGGYISQLEICPKASLLASVPRISLHVPALAAVSGLGAVIGTQSLHALDQAMSGEAHPRPLFNM